MPKAPEYGPDMRISYMVRYKLQERDPIRTPDYGEMPDRR